MIKPIDSKGFPIDITGFHDSTLYCVGTVKNSKWILILYLGELHVGVIKLNNALQSTIVFLRYITAIKSVAAFSCFRLCLGCGFHPT